MPMTDVQALAIIRRIREVLDDGYGTLRTISSGQVSLHSGGPVDDADAAQDAMVKPRIKVRLGGWAPSDSRPMDVTGNVDAEEVTWSVEAQYYLPPEEQGEGYATTESVRAQALADCSRFKSALEYPSNLLADSTAVSTGIVAGTVIALGAAEPRESPSDGIVMLTYVHRYRAIVQVAETVS